MTDGIGSVRPDQAWILEECTGDKLTDEMEVWLYHANQGGYAWCAASDVMPASGVFVIRRRACQRPYEHVLTWTVAMNGQLGAHCKLCFKNWCLLPLSGQEIPSAAIDAVAKNSHDFTPHVNKCTDNHWQEWRPEAKAQIETYLSWIDNKVWAQ